MKEKKIKLSKYILSYLGSLNLKGQNQKILTYLLDRNIKTIFGKERFDKEEILGIQKQTYRIDDFTNRNCFGKTFYCLKIKVLDSIYMVSSNLDENTIEMKKESSQNDFYDDIFFKITYYENIFHNVIKYKMENEMRVEWQNIFTEKNIAYDYQKIIYNTQGEEIVYPALRLSPINTKIGRIEYFCIETLFDDMESKKELWHTIRDKMQTNSQPISTKLHDLLSILIYLRKKRQNVVSVPIHEDFQSDSEYWNAIFKILEERCQIGNYELVRRK